MAKKVLTVQEKYDFVQVTSGRHYVAGFGLIDLDKLTIEEADALFRAKFPFLAKKSKAPAQETTE